MFHVSVLLCRWSFSLWSTAHVQFSSILISSYRFIHVLICPVHTSSSVIDMFCTIQHQLCSSYRFIRSVVHHTTSVTIHVHQLSTSVTIHIQVHIAHQEGSNISYHHIQVHIAHHTTTYISDTSSLTHHINTTHRVHIAHHTATYITNTTTLNPTPNPGHWCSMICTPPAPHAVVILQTAHSWGCWSHFQASQLHQPSCRKP
jgi:hypothetical protein